MPFFFTDNKLENVRPVFKIFGWSTVHVLSVIRPLSAVLMSGIVLFQVNVVCAGTLSWYDHECVPVLCDK